MEYVKIKKHPQYEICKEGIIRKIKTGAIKSQYVNDRGYYMISIRYGKISKPCRVHRLLAGVFIPNPFNLPEVNHKDGNKLNNQIHNLEWVTHQDNISHAIRIGLVNNRGSNNGMAKLHEKDIPAIRRLLQDGMAQEGIAQKFNVSRSAILNIKRGTHWKNIY